MANRGTKRKRQDDASVIYSALPDDTRVAEFICSGLGFDWAKVPGMFRDRLVREAIKNKWHMARFLRGNPGLLKAANDAVKDSASTDFSSGQRAGQG